MKANYTLSIAEIPVDFGKKYTENISTYRNALGHRVAADKFIKINGIDVPVDENLHRIMRENIRNMEILVDTLECFVETRI